MFRAMVAASPVMNRPGMNHSPKDPKTIVTTMRRPATRAYPWIEDARGSASESPVIGYEMAVMAGKMARVSWPAPRPLQTLGLRERLRRQRPLGFRDEWE